MNEPIIAPPLAGSILGMPNDSFVVAEWQDKGGPLEPPRLIAARHVHHNDDEAWYVLEGTPAKPATATFSGATPAALVPPRGSTPPIGHSARPCAR